MKLTTVITAVAALFIGTQSADAGLLDFLRLNNGDKHKCEVKTSKPKCAKPAAPKCAKPAAPKCAKPAAPKCAKPAAPKTATKSCDYEKKTTLLPQIRLPRIRRISFLN
tara:strand:- start:232 stop:558 length:327 start_codon:yes stop_codon:yes gene_type:complete